MNNLIEIHILRPSIVWHNIKTIIKHPKFLLKKYTYMIFQYDERHVFIDLKVAQIYYFRK